MHTYYRNLGKYREVWKRKQKSRLCPPIQWAGLCFKFWSASKGISRCICACVDFQNWSCSEYNFGSFLAAQHVKDLALQLITTALQVWSLAWKLPYAFGCGQKQTKERVQLCTEIFFLNNFIRSILSLAFENNVNSYKIFHHLNITIYLLIPSCLMFRFLLGFQC